jgi:hypothetical protein
MTDPCGYIDKRMSQLNKNPLFVLFYYVWARQESDLRPSDYESPALTTAPRALDQLTMKFS